MNWRIMASALALAALMSSAAAADEVCPGHPDALGVSRVLTVDPTQFPGVGTVNYRDTLPLAPGEVVLTFDDGPVSPHTERVLDVLRDNCIKAVFFLIGRNAQHNPALVRRIIAEGHTIGTHTQNHPRGRMSPDRAVREISTGIASVTAAAGDPQKLAPFFRFPGLNRTSYAEEYLRERGLMSWSVDADSWDWKRITPEQVLHNAMTRLAAKGRGIILLHDVHAKTAELLPELLAELKAGGYRIVQVVPAPRPATPALVAGTDHKPEAVSPTPQELSPPKARPVALAPWETLRMPSRHRIRVARAIAHRHGPHLRKPRGLVQHGYRFNPAFSRRGRAG